MCAVPVWKALPPEFLTTKTLFLFRLTKCYSVLLFLWLFRRNISHPTLTVLEEAWWLLNALALSSLHILRAQHSSSGASLVAQLAGEESACNAGDAGSMSGSGRSAGGIGHPLQYSWTSLVAQLVKNLPAMQETWVLCTYHMYIMPVQCDNFCTVFSVLELCACSSHLIVCSLKV